MTMNQSGSILPIDREAWLSHMRATLYIPSHLDLGPPDDALMILGPFENSAGDGLYLRAVAFLAHQRRRS